MKLLRYGPVGKEKPGLLGDDGKIRDLSAIIPDINGETISPKSLARLRKIKPESLPAVRGNPRIGACVANPQKFVAIGLNYSDHAAESGLTVPKEPIIFTKQVSCIVRPERRRDHSAEVQEVGLGSGAWRHHRHQGEEHQEEGRDGHVAGYCVVNDISEREFQIERSGQWTKGKCYDTFGPIGPWMVTADEIKDPQKLGMWLELNGKRVQNGTTATMVYGVAVYRGLSLGILHPDAGRHHHHRHASGRGHGHEAAALSEARRHHAFGHRRTGRAVPDGLPRQVGSDPHPAFGHLLHPGEGRDPALSAWLRSRQLGPLAG
jgi:2-keto-4-pentenoate hydratase/2-oxohepta-3-ene-1,7-dioic acid hydratase in catechol pathway